MSASAQKNYRPETRLVQSGTLRSPFGETSEALFLTQGYVYDSCRAGRDALQERRPGLSIFALRQSDRRHVRARAWRPSKAPKPRARPRPAWRRSRWRWSARSRPAITSSPRRRCSAPAAISSRIICRASASRRRWSTAAISMPGARPSGRTPRPSFSKARPTRRSKSSTSPKWRRSRTRPARRSSSTTCSPRRCFRRRSRSAPTAWSIRRPSISTARAAASAASCSARRSSSSTISICCCGRPARRCRRSMPGCC